VLALKPFLLSTSILAMIAAATATPIEWRWTAHYSGPGPSGAVGQEVVADADGNYYVSGFASGGVYLVKYDIRGNQKWAAMYPCPTGWANGLALDSKGDILVCGTANGGTSSMDIFLAKFSATGKYLWHKKFNGPTNQNDYAAGFVLDSENNAYVAGTTANATPSSDAVLLKYDSKGSLLWNISFDGPAHLADTAKAIAHSRAMQCVYLVGSIGESGGGSSMLIQRVEKNGSCSLLQAPRGGLKEVALCVAVDALGNVSVAGTTGNSQTTLDIVTHRFTAEDDFEWSVDYAGPGGGMDQPVRTLFDSSGNCILTGVSSGVGTGEDVVTISYEPGGGVNWERIYSTAGQDNPTAMTCDAAGSVYIAGFARGDSGTADYLGIGYTTSGTPFWTQSYQGVFGADDQAYGICLDRWRNIIVTGGSFDVPTNPWSYECATIKFIQPTVLQPETATFLRGFAVSGGIAELLAIDQSYLSSRPGAVFNVSDWPDQLSITTTLEDLSLTELRFVAVTGVTAPALLVNIDFYDYQASVWRNQSSLSGTLADTMTQLGVTSNFERFIDPASRQVRARIRLKANGAIFFYPWTARADYVAWAIVH
jgi:hypothetical protein